MNLFLLAMIAALSIASLHVLQPLLPTLATEFGISGSTIALVTTASLLPLAVAPFVYGYVIEGAHTKRVIQVCLLLLIVASLGQYWAPDFLSLLVLRVVQGVAVAGVLPALMTHISRMAEPAHVQRLTGAYIAFTIVGGYLGRAGSGYLATHGGWRFSLLVLALLLVFCFVMLSLSKADEVLHPERPGWPALRAVLKQNGSAYAIIFCCFFSFSAILNFLPFRLKNLHEGISDLGIGLSYSGYLIGIVAAWYAVPLARRLGGLPKTIVVGLLLFLLALAGWLATGLIPLYLNMFLFCAAMFLVHALASGSVNSGPSRHKGLANGVYVSAYYAGGTLGSYLPGLVYHGLGWSSFLTGLAIVLCAALVVAVKQTAAAA
jgi:YNFM family putative membrane transporter